MPGRWQRCSGERMRKGMQARLMMPHERLLLQCFYLSHPLPTCVWYVFCFAVRLCSLLDLSHDKMPAKRRRTVHHAAWHC
jgi:hypothetical protein